MACAALLLAACATQPPTPRFDNADFIQVSPGVWLESAFSRDEQAQALVIFAKAQRRILAFYGEQLAAMPQLVWCKTPACRQWLSGSTQRSAFVTRGRRFSDGQFVAAVHTIFLTRSLATAEDALTHELSHSEVAARLEGRRLPAWFNEGLASLVGQETRCSPHMQQVEHIERLDSGSDWVSFTQAEGQRLMVPTYCAARERVAQWLAAHGGVSMLVRALARMRSEAFEVVWAAPLRP